MAIQQINQISRPQEQTKTKRSRTGQALGNVLGVVGGVAGAVAGGVSGGPASAITGGIGGASGGRGLGSALGESVDPSKQVSAGAQSPQPRQLQLSPNAREFADTLKILQQLPPEIGQRASQSLTAALMQDLANTNARQA